MMSRIVAFLRRTFAGTKWFPALKGIYRLGLREEHWARVVMNRSTSELVAGLSPSGLSALEISGEEWAQRASFREYRAVHFPSYDICADPLPETFDLIIAEQVFEHLLRPYRAAQNVYQMLNPGGRFLITTPFLIRVHDCPVDCSRWTELGLKYFLAEVGFPFESIKTFSWGNRACVISTLSQWTHYRPAIHSLRNEPDFPVVVWALAQKL